MEKTGFVKQHWQNLKDIGLFKMSNSYEEYINEREAEDKKKKEDGFLEEGFIPSAESVVGSVKSVWVKKSVSQSDWKNKYIHYNSYCNLGEAGDFDHHYIGFLVAIPPEVEKAGTVNSFLEDRNLIRLTDYEMIAVDNYRRANGISPTPLEKVPTEGEAEEVEPLYQEGFAF